MKNISIDHNQPHHVLLVFEGNTDAYKNEYILQERSNYYQKLKEQGKVVLGGNFWNIDRIFIIVHVTCAAELETIIENDPGLNNDILELLRVVPFSPDFETGLFNLADQYQLDQFA